MLSTKKPLSAYCNSSRCSPKQNYISSVGVKKDVKPRTISCPDCFSVLQWTKTDSRHREGNQKSNKAKPIKRDFVINEAEILDGGLPWPV